LTGIKIGTNTGIASFDITSMYSNTPILELILILENFLKTKCIVEKQQRDLFGVYDIMIKTISHIKIHSTNRWSSNEVSFVCHTIKNIPQMQ